MKKLLFSLTFLAISLSASAFASPIDGDWENSECKRTSNYDGRFQKVFLNVDSKKNEISIAIVVYKDKECKRELFEHGIIGFIDVTSPKKNKSSLEFEYENQTITPLNKKLAKQLKRSNACLRNSWEKGRTISVSGKICLNTTFVFNGTKIDGNYKINKKGNRAKMYLEGLGPDYAFDLERSE